MAIMVLDTAEESLYSCTTISLLLSLPFYIFPALGILNLSLLFRLFFSFPSDSSLHSTLSLFSSLAR